MRKISQLLTSNKKEEEKMEIIKGGVTAAKGFEAASAAAGIKYKDRTDMAMIYSRKPCRDIYHQCGESGSG